MFPEGARPPPTDAVLNRISQEFLYEDLASATSNFSASCRLGEGTYGTVFRGTLRDGTEVAIKLLSSPKEGGFREEVEVLSKFRHPNLVILMGFARNGRERYLVYELLPGGDVNHRLNNDAGFTWRQRLNVILDAALGLSHLHGSRPQVFHRDVKTQNILMDRNGTGKVADFGLACLAQPNQDRMQVSQTSGTIGYADPLYIRTGVVTEKSEVYSLGMVLLEVLTGRPPALQHPSGRIEYQFEHLNGELRKLFAMVDRRGQWPEIMIQRVGQLALQCTCAEEAFRPTFVEIVTQLRAWLRDETLTQAGSGPPAALQAQKGGGKGQNGIGAPGAAQGSPQGHGAGGGDPYAQPKQQSPWPQPQAAPAGAPRPGGGQGNPFNNPAAQGSPQRADWRPFPERRPSAPDGAGGHAAAGYVPAQQPAADPAAAAQAAQLGDPGFLHRARVAMGGSPAEELQPPPTASGREEEIQTLLAMGFTHKQAVDAFKRCSTVEGAIEWISSQT